MLSDKIKGKSALKARTFLHVVLDKVHACYWYRLSMHLSTENSAGYQPACTNIFKTPSYGLGLRILGPRENSAGYQPACTNIFKTPSYGLGLGILGPRYGEIFLPIRSIRSIGILQQWSLTWISLSQTLYRQTCLGQGLGVTITARKRTSKLMFTPDP